MSSAMRTSPLAGPTTDPRSAADHQPAVLRGLATAVPDTVQSQRELAATMQRIWQLQGKDRLRWQRIVAGTGIDQRRGVLPIEDVVNLSTAQRMQLYQQHAPALAADASRRAMLAADVDAADITDVVVVSCTGFSAPGVDVALIDLLGLPRDLRRLLVGFMGCFGAISGLRTAAAIAAADPDAVVLVACVELCSLHLRTDPGVQNQVASALFADGAAAAVVTQQTGTGRPGGGIESGELCIGSGLSRLSADDRDAMTWTITDHGFAMTLSPQVPVAIRRNIRSFLDDTSGRGGIAATEFIAAHPGGPEILNAVQDSLQPGQHRDIDAARAVLREHGNMSSPTVLFVLQRLLNEGRQPPGLLLAFGPGLTMECLGLTSA